MYLSEKVQREIEEKLPKEFKTQHKLLQKKQGTALLCAATGTGTMYAMKTMLLLAVNNIKNCRVIIIDGERNEYRNMIDNFIETSKGLGKCILWENKILDYPAIPDDFDILYYKCNKHMGSFDNKLACLQDALLRVYGNPNLTEDIKRPVWVFCDGINDYFDREPVAAAVVAWLLRHTAENNTVAYIAEYSADGIMATEVGKRLLEEIDFFTFLSIPPRERQYFSELLSFDDELIRDKPAGKGIVCNKGKIQKIAFPSYKDIPAVKYLMIKEKKS